MRQQVRVIKQRLCRRFSVVKYALAAFRYLVTGFVALLLVLLLVEVGAAIGASSTPARTCPLPTISEDLLRAQAHKGSGFCGFVAQSEAVETRNTL
jgi:hypothetical protein